MSSSKCILFWRTRPALQSEGVGSQWTQHQSKASSEVSYTRWAVSGPSNSQQALHWIAHQMGSAERKVEGL